jgi:cation transport ATPase
MRRLGLEIVMLTGDSADTAEAIRREVAPNGEISRLRAGVLPGHKAEGEGAAGAGASGRDGR